MATETLTVLFTDLVASTRALSRLAPPSADRVMARHFALLRDQVERHRGRVIKTLGDGVMATFRSGRDAIDAATMMQRALAHSRRSPQGPRLAMRVGISSGDVLTREGDCRGVPVIEASRVCARAAGDEILVADSTRVVIRDGSRLVPRGEAQLKGLAEPTRLWEAPWVGGDNEPVRVVLADDAALVREGVAHVLEAAGMDVVGQAGNADELMRLVAELRPDLAIVDVRMPPTHTREGLNAAIRIRETHPRTGVLLLSMDVERRYATKLLRASPTGVGYLLKDSVADVGEFTAASRTVAAGGTAFASALNISSDGRRVTTDGAGR